MLAEPLVGEKEEDFILDHRAAKSGAEIVALERGLRPLADGVEEVSSVQVVVPEKLKQFAVIFVGAGARGKIHDGARVSPILRGKRRIVDLVFRQRIDWRLECDLV